MDLIVAWVVFPLVLLAVCVGCGLAVEAVTRRKLPDCLLPATGLALAIVAGQALTVADATAELATPAIVALAVAGLAFGLRRRGGASEPWAYAAAGAVFALLAAPIVLSGEPTIAGFIKLDDTATWLALTDRIMAHGRSLAGLPGSTYEATLQFNLGQGYPIGVFVPLGAGSKLVGTDPAWLIQPYMAFLGAILALGLWSLATPLAASRHLRAGSVVVGALPALLFGYYLWGGIKEIAAAALIAATVALALGAVKRSGEPSRLVAPAFSSAALIGVLSAGAGLWLLPILIPAAVILARAIGARAAARRALAMTAGVAVLSIPVILPGALLPPTSSPLTDGGARGNLVAPLDPLQLAGIWGSGDFRFRPGHELLTYGLIAVAILAAIAGIVWSLRRRQLGPPLLVLGMLAGCAVIALVGSPWVDGKAFATASVAIPFAAMLGVCWLASAGRRIGAGVIGLAVAGGVAWSNALAYQDVNLAPREQLVELERIGERIAGQGPTLITEYSPYGARHFLRDADPESISELRRRPVVLNSGLEVHKGLSADTDQIDPAALDVYRTLVVRRSPAASRPPSEYDLIWIGASYEAWQRTPGAVPAIERLPLGDRHDPVAVPSCRQVRRLGAQAPSSGRLLASRFPEPLVAPVPAGYSRARTGVSPSLPLSLARIEAEVEVPRFGEYVIWLGGSIRSQAVTSVDGRVVGSVRHQLNNSGGYVDLGTTTLASGRHTVEVQLGGADLHPGSGGAVGPVGPLVLSDGEAAEARVISFDPADPGRLCGKPWDWIELVGAQR